MTTGIDGPKDLVNHNILPHDDFSNLLFEGLMLFYQAPYGIHV
jgi:hypothetical protein